MPLGLAVLLVVLAVTAVIAALGCLIDKIAERDERNQGVIAQMDALVRNDPASESEIEQAVQKFKTGTESDQSTSLSRSRRDE